MSIPETETYMKFVWKQDYKWKSNNIGSKRHMWAASHLAKKKTKRDAKGISLILDWNLWKAAYVPISRIKPNVVQFTKSWTINWTAFTFLVIKCKQKKRKYVENKA